jgi:hypothetical protein
VTTVGRVSDGPSCLSYDPKDSSVSPYGERTESGGTVKPRNTDIRSTVSEDVA